VFDNDKNNYYFGALNFLNYLLKLTLFAVIDK